MIPKRLLFQFSFTLVIIFISFGAQAQIYKCLENGKTVFRDKPCKGGQGEEFSLGATIEATDPSGTLGDITGSWEEKGHAVAIRDALGILDQKSSLLSLYLVPDRFTASEVRHFQDGGDDSLLKQKPAVTHAGFNTYPFINLRIQFSKNQPRKRDSIESAELLVYGLDGEQPRKVQLDSREAVESIRYISVFEDIGYGDVNLESDGDAEETSWKISIKAPLYYH